MVCKYRGICRGYIIFGSIVGSDYYAAPCNSSVGMAYRRHFASAVAGRGFVRRRGGTQAL